MNEPLIYCLAAWAKDNDFPKDYDMSQVKPKLKEAAILLKQTEQEYKMLRSALEEIAQSLTYEAFGLSPKEHALKALKEVK